MTASRENSTLQQQQQIKRIPPGGRNRLLICRANIAQIWDRLGRPFTDLRYKKKKEQTTHVCRRSVYHKKSKPATTLLRCSSITTTYCDLVDTHTANQRIVVTIEATP